MKMKKLAALFLTGAMMIGAFAGCGSSSEGTSEAPAATNESSTTTSESASAENQGAGGTVEFWNDKLSNIDQVELDKIINATESASGYTFEMSAYPDTASYQTALQQTINGAEAPGLFTWWSGEQLETLAKNGLIEDLTSAWEDYLLNTGLSQSVADAFTVDGKIYAAPYAVCYTNLLYNKDVFEKYNLQEPTNFDEFLSICETLKSNGVTPIGLKNDSWAGFIWFQQLLAVKDINLYYGICDGSVKFTDPKVVEVMEIWNDMLQKGYFSAPLDYQTDFISSFADGNVAMILEADYALSKMNKDYGVVEGENVDTFVVPGMDGQKGTIFFEVSPLCVASNSAQKEDAMNVLKAWFTNDVQTALRDATGMAGSSAITIEEPTQKEILASAGDENTQLVLRYYESTPTELRDLVLDELMKFELMNTDVDSVVNAMQQKADEVFSN